jgi:hypothetical protein
MDQHQRQSLSTSRFRLPMAMAKYTAAVGRVYLDCFRCAYKPEGGPGKIITYNGLKMAIAESAPRLKRGIPPRRIGNHAVKRCIFLVFLNHFRLGKLGLWQCSS